MKLHIQNFPTKQSVIYDKSTVCEQVHALQICKLDWVAKKLFLTTFST